MTQNATDFENQVVNLVKAAMSGDEEANDVIVQIIEAAKKGDEQALKVVALIKQLTQSNSDQAEEGAEENTEAMKCGGKVRAKMKAKKSTEKKEEGGEIPEEKCGGTAKKMRKAACKAKKCEEGDKLTDTQKFLLGAKCGCKVKKTKKCEKGDTLDNWEDPLSVKCGGKVKKHQYGGTATYYVGPNGDMEQATPEMKIDRMRKYGAPSTRNISYNYVPGEIHVVSGIDSAPVYVNTNTGKYIKNDKGVHLPVVEKESGTSNYNSYQRTIPDQDIYRFPDGTVARRRGDIPDIPRIPVDYPVLPNDNTSTAGSALQGGHGNIRGGVYSMPIEPITVPEDYVPEEWQEIHDNVNGQIRITWRNPRTGEIVTTKPNGVIIPVKANGGYLDFSKIAFNKCGGKAKKVKKGEAGVQLPEGAHGQTWSRSTSAIFAKGGNTCPCALKRVGGKIVTVDSCTGLPIHKNGGNVNYLQTGGVYHIGGSIKKFQSPDSPIKKNKFFQYLSEMGPMLRGARLNSPAVTNVEETVKTNPVKAKYDAALYGYSDLMGAVSGVGGALAYHPTMIAQLPQLSTVSGVTFGAAPAIGMSSVAFSETPLNSSSEQHQTTTNQEQPTTVSAPAVVSEQPVSTAVQEQPADPAASVVNQEQSAAPATPAVTQETFMSWLKKNAPSYQSYNSRKQLAEQYGIANYKGTTAQNILLWNKMKQAKYGWDNPHNVYKTISENRVENNFTNPEEKQFALNALLNPQEILPKQQVLSIQPANIKIPEIKLYTTNN